MNASLWMVAGLACAQLGGINMAHAQEAPAPRPAASTIVAVTVYKGQAQVTREVVVPEGEGTFELVVAPMPSQTVDGSLFTEGAEGLRVLSTRYRSRAVKEDTREGVRTKEDTLKKLGADAQRLERQVAVQGQDLQYLQKLEGFTGTALANLTDRGIDGASILDITRFVMQTRAEKSKVETDLRQQLQANAEAAGFAKRELAELTSGSSRVERDAVVVVQKTRPGAATVRLGYLVNSASWTPQYRLRGTTDDAPVRLEYLAAVAQQTGEAWPDVRLTLSTARPSLDAAPPDLLPLKMAIAGGGDASPIEAHDDRSQRISVELGKPVEMSFPSDTPLREFLHYVQKSTGGPAFPDGIPIYVDPEALTDIDKTLDSATVAINLRGVPLRTTLALALKQVQLVYHVREGLLKITSRASDDEATAFPQEDGFAGTGGATTDQAQTPGVATLNREAASDQAEEMNVERDPASAAPGVERDGPSVSFAVAGPIGIPSRRDSMLVEVGRIELPAEYHAKAVPVLTPRVYRLAKLTNTSDLVILPGEATAYVGGEFVGRMKLPLVAAGEPFVAGFGVDPQVQVTRRLMRKARTVQGGNQVFTYEFRIGLRNYRARPIKVQLWDRLPTPEGEAVVVNLVKTSDELSADALYQRTARVDNLLRWDLDVPPGTVGDKTKYLNYEFRLEYSRDLAQPSFVSGGLKESPIGGGAMGGSMGGMGGMRSVKP